MAETVNMVERRKERYRLLGQVVPLFVFLLPDGDCLDFAKHALRKIAH